MKRSGIQELLAFWQHRPWITLSFHPGYHCSNYFGHWWWLDRWDLLQLYSVASRVRSAHQIRAVRDAPFFSARLPALVRGAHPTASYSLWEKGRGW